MDPCLAGRWHSRLLASRLWVVHSSALCCTSQACRTRIVQLSLLAIPLVLINGYQAYLLLGVGFVADNSLIRMASGLCYAVWPASRNLGCAQYRVLYASLFAGAVRCVNHIDLAYGPRFRPRFRLSSDLLPVLFRFGLKTQFASIASQANLRADQAVMSFILSPGQIGQYVVAVAVSGILNPFLTALAVVILPRASNTHDIVEGARLVIRHVQLAFLLALPVLVLATIFMPNMLIFLFGEMYAPATLAARVLVAASIFQGKNAVLGNSLRGLGRPGSPAIAEGVGMLVTARSLSSAPGTWDSRCGHRVAVRLRHRRNYSIRLCRPRCGVDHTEPDVHWASIAALAHL